MKGRHRITVSNATVKYDFCIKRNITIIKGDSATGKTTLVELINEYYESGASSGVNLNSDKECRVLAGRDWKTIISTIRDSIVFIDEDNDFLPTDDFAREVRKSDNYYVIVTREGLPNLPYSVDEIYGIRTSGKYAGFSQTYNEFYHIYSDHTPDVTVVPDVVITEDSNSGYEFFEGLSKGKNYDVVSAAGKTNVFAKALEASGEVIIIADGAAFGAEMDRIMKLVRQNKGITLYLPESFEWLILRSGIVENAGIDAILEYPYEFIESSRYFSWERFFTQLLVDKTNDTYLKYSKKSLNMVYLQESIAKRIVDIIKDIEL